MYKCICANITEKQIRDLLEQGLTLQEVYTILEVGKNCGQCVLEDKDNGGTDNK